jgi:hypothetical protein
MEVIEEIKKSLKCTRLRQNYYQGCRIRRSKVLTGHRGGEEPSGG